ncbi:MAG TPA: 30S ribosomal protein S1, partial [Janibacter terrae]|nr:30S ribosomal protein S1 [Janibacter terrae]
ETNEWLEGYDTQREAWEKQYADAHARWEAHRAQMEKAAADDAAAAEGGADSVSTTSYSSDS